MGSFLKPAEIEQSAAKCGIFARQGAGKTTTAILILIGLSKTYHNSAPIAMMDTENGSDFIKDICDIEKVPLIVGKSRAFTDMRRAETEARAGGACGFLVDSYSHPWKELCDTFKNKSRRKKLEFHHMDELKTLWNEWTQQMLNSPLHIVMAGRLGFEWGQEEDEDGTRELVKLGTKMKSESEAGYEPNLLIELEGIMPTVLEKKTHRRGVIVHRATVLKDRWRALNGRSFDWKDLNTYKPGDYKKVFEAFMPHWKNLKIGTTQRAVDSDRSSAALFNDQGDSAYRVHAQRKDVALAEAKGILDLMFPGTAGKEKAIRGAIVEKLFDAYSPEAVAQRPLEVVEEAVQYLRFFKTQMAAAKEPPATPHDMVAFLELCIVQVKDAAIDALVPALGSPEAAALVLSGEGSF